MWLPILGHDDEAAAADAAALMTDPRVSHFWNPDLEIARATAKALDLDREMETAWDVFLVYEPGVRWRSAELMPTPTAWMQRLSSHEHPRWMDPARLARVVKTLLPDKK